MKTFQAKRVKIGAQAQCAGIFLTCMTLASCSSNQNTFFAQTNVLMSQGYKWQKLERCRPAREDALSIPLINPDGRKMVCYRLAPPQNGIAASANAATSVTSVPAAPTAATPSGTNSRASGIIWNFSNF